MDPRSFSPRHDAATCMSCISLRQSAPIVSSQGLREMVTRIAPPVQAGRLVQVAGDSTFGDLSKGLCEDWVYQRFLCTRCGQEYELSIESFEGAGGVWRPLPQGPSRVSEAPQSPT
jgi:hypothetical protein